MASHLRWAVMEVSVASPNHGESQLTSTDTPLSLMSCVVGRLL